MSTRNQMVLCNSKNQEVFKTLIPLVISISTECPQKDIFDLSKFYPNLLNFTLQKSLIMMYLRKYFHCTKK